jgi:hypothetical protein|tara:strand:- start:322 stop:564 length:243 start_codon:yes stop_codon:yes gene_type:complete
MKEESKKLESVFTDMFVSGISIGGITFSIIHLGNIYFGTIFFILFILVTYQGVSNFKSLITHFENQNQEKVNKLGGKDGK